LVTLQDLFEVLIGDILGRKDFLSNRFYMPDEGTLIASSRMELERVEELLEEGTELAVVLDEYGALAGLVTLQDLFEVLIGDILGRRDFVSQRFYMPDEDTLIASSRMELERVEELLAIELDADDVETLGGYLMKILGEVPEPGHRYVRNGVTWTVLNAEGPALGMIKVESER
jgi:CBS domain containing-hemolysin-like protein